MCARLLLVSRSPCTGTDSEICLVAFEDAYDSGFEDMQRHIPDTSKIEALIDWRPTRTLTR
jgi:UDP-glucose 4-epimerase